VSVQILKAPKTSSKGLATHSLVELTLEIYRVLADEGNCGVWNEERRVISISGKIHLNVLRNVLPMQREKISIVLRQRIKHHLLRYKRRKLQMPFHRLQGNIALLLYWINGLARGMEQSHTLQMY